MGKRKAMTPQEHSLVTEDFRIGVDEILRDFVKDFSIPMYEFPSYINNICRKYIHEKCRKMGLKSKSQGREPNRIIYIYKKPRTENIESFPIDLCDETIQELRPLLNNQVVVSYDNSKKQQNGATAGETVGRLFMSQKVVVSDPPGNPFGDFRCSLPIYCMKRDILNAIADNQVLIISAETGSGKTTQIPQYILEDACSKMKQVRVICTQPRRLSTIAVAERVSSERGETLGQTVGYQIKLESRMGSRTALLYCTNGVLLRTLMSGNGCLEHITHIIVDEIHERDKFSDFLLICLRECLATHPHLRVILMSATMDMEIYQRYFKNVHIVSVAGRSFEIDVWFLENILERIKYETDGMRQMRIIREKKSFGKQAPPVPMVQDNPIEDISPEVAADMTDAIKAYFDNGLEDDHTHLLQLILSENVNPNYQEPNEGLTALMAAAKHGNLEFLESLLHMGSDPFTVSKLGFTASGWAQQHNQEDIVNVLAMYRPPESSVDRSSQLLADYDCTVKEDFIDFNLIVALVKYIDAELKKPGAILIFLPGYDDIMQCFDHIEQCGLTVGSYKIFMLHGSMQMGAQHQIFTRLPEGQRKIILSTNLAETSITIDDVRYVIDSGKAKEKSYDALSGISSLQTHWISMASARQRAGRAGRTQNGYCFHLYSYQRYESFNVSTTPEILRVPLDELCLHTKMLAPKDVSIESFLNLALEPPSPAAVHNSIGALKNLGALDNEENLTQLGYHLVQLSIEPHLGKMLIYAVILKCLDPILTIVACQAHKDPFNLPTQGNLKNIAFNKRKALADGIYSDHVTLLKIFQMWEEAKVTRSAYRFCDEYFVSNAIMELIMLTRMQLLSQLRAIGFIQANPRDAINEVNRNSDSWPMVKACLAVGLYPNVAFYNDRRFHTRTEKHIYLHASSVLKNTDFESSGSVPVKQCWALFEELSKNRMRCTVKGVTLINPLTILLMCGLQHMLQPNGIALDDWFELRFENPDLVQCRLTVNGLIEKKINMPRYRYQAREEEILAAVKKVLSIEDSVMTLSTPDGVGNRPRLVHYRIQDNGNGRDGRASGKHYRQGGGNWRNDCNSQQGKRNDRHVNNWRNQGNQERNFDQRGNQFGSTQSFNCGIQQRNFEQRNSRYNQPNNFEEYEDFQSDKIPSLNQRTNFSSNTYRSFSAQSRQPDDVIQQVYMDQPGPSSRPDFNSSTPVNTTEAAMNRLFPIHSLYFIIKPLEDKNILIAMTQCTWNFAPHTERKLFKLFADGYKIILIYTAKSTNFFHGVAYLKNTNVGHPNKPCPIEWISKRMLNHTDVKTFIHPKIHLREDGNQLEPYTGQKLAYSIYDFKAARQLANDREILQLFV